jgi:hypothetical protein
LSTGLSTGFSTGNSWDKVLGLVLVAALGGCELRVAVELRPVLGVELDCAQSGAERRQKAAPGSTRSSTGKTLDSALGCALGYWLSTGFSTGNSTRSGAWRGTGSTLEPLWGQHLNNTWNSTQFSMFGSVQCLTGARTPLRRALVRSSVLKSG